MVAPAYWANTVPSGRGELVDQVEVTKVSSAGEVVLEQADSISMQEPTMYGTRRKSPTKRFVPGPQSIACEAIQPKFIANCPVTFGFGVKL